LKGSSTIMNNIGVQPQEASYTHIKHSKLVRV
jgi:hypothetical protein